MLSFLTRKGQGATTGGNEGGVVTKQARISELDDIANEELKQGVLFDRRTVLPSVWLAFLNIADDPKSPTVAPFIPQHDLQSYLCPDNGEINDRGVLTFEVVSATGDAQQCRILPYVTNRPQMDWQKKSQHYNQFYKLQSKMVVEVLDSKGNCQRVFLGLEGYKPGSIESTGKIVAYGVAPNGDLAPVKYVTDNTTFGELFVSTRTAPAASMLDLEASII